MSENKSVFSIEQLKNFMVENSIERNIINCVVKMSISDYIAAFEHWCQTGQNPIHEWDDLQELILLREKIFRDKTLENDTHILQFIHDFKIEKYVKIIEGKPFWNIDKYLNSKNINIIHLYGIILYLSSLNEEREERKERNIEKLDKYLSQDYGKITEMGIVYVITNNKNQYKIGQTRNLSERLTNLQTGNPDKLEIVLNYEIAGYKFVEQLLKSKYKDKSVRVDKTEWYNLSETDIQDIKNIFETYTGGNIILYLVHDF